MHIPTEEELWHKAWMRTYAEHLAGESRFFFALLNGNICYIYIYKYVYTYVCIYIQYRNRKLNLKLYPIVMLRIVRYHSKTIRNNYENSTFFNNIVMLYR